MNIQAKVIPSSSHASRAIPTRISNRWSRGRRHRAFHQTLSCKLDAAALKIGEPVKVDPNSLTTVTKLVSLGPHTPKGIYRICSDAPDFNINFNQFLLLDDKPLLFHTGMSVMFPAVRDAIDALIPIDSLAYVFFSHDEADESGSVNEICQVTPNVTIGCSKIEAMINSTRFVKPLTGFADGEEVSLGSMNVRWLDTPHLPHGWGCGYLFETTTRTMLSGDILFQWGIGEPPLVPATSIGDIKGLPDQKEVIAWTPNTRGYVEKLLQLKPQMLCCMHGSTLYGPGCEGVLKELADMAPKYVTESA